MNFEQEPGLNQEEEDNNEQENRIKITMEDVDKINKSSVDSEELESWMKEKGIEFNKGMVKESIDDENYLFNTDKNDFGTISYPEDKMGHDLADEKKSE